MIQNNNPNGYNKHKKNPKPIVIQPPIIDKEMVQKAFREKWLAHRESLSKSDRYSFLKKKFLGLDVIEKELEEEAEKG